MQTQETPIQVVTTKIQTQMIKIATVIQKNNH